MNASRRTGRDRTGSDPTGPDRAGPDPGEPGSGGRPFWLSPKWVVGHVLAIVLVVSFVSFGFWQLRRLDERQAENALLEERSSLPVEPLGEVVGASDTFDQVDRLAYRRVSARGHYDAGGTVLVRSRSLNGNPGFHVLTPLVTADDVAVVVNRGFAPFTGEPAEALAATRPAEGEVTVTGLLFTSQEREGIGPTDPAEGVLTQIARVDLARLQQQSRHDLYPVYLHLVDQEPAPAQELPVVLPEPEQSEGNHLSYAVQWFFFAAIGAVGWPLLLRSTARDRRRSGGADRSHFDPPVPAADQPTDNGQERAAAAPRP